MYLCTPYLGSERAAGGSNFSSVAHGFLKGFNKNFINIPIHVETPTVNVITLPKIKRYPTANRFILEYDRTNKIHVMYDLRRILY